MNILLYGIFLIFSSTNGISSEKLANELKINYKSACLLNTKCRILMRQSNSGKRLDSKFYIINRKKNQYPKYIKMKEIEVDNIANIKKFFGQYVYMNRDTTLTTDGKNTVNFLKDQINVENEKIDYKDPNHNLWFLNICISNFNSMLLGT